MKAFDIRLALESEKNIASLLVLFVHIYHTKVDPAVFTVVSVFAVLENLLAMENMLLANMRKNQ